MRSRQRRRVAGLVLLALCAILANRLAGEPVGAAAANQEGVRLELLGHHALEGEGLDADVWLHRGVAYVGTWRSGEPGGGCPGTGVKVVEFPGLAGSSPDQPTGRPGLLTSITEPGPGLQPIQAASLAEHPATTAEVMRVRAVETPTFRGDLLAVGLQACSAEGLRGLDLWDVTNPRAPERLGFLDVGPGVGGVHELDLVQRPDGRVLALLAVPFSEGGHPERLGDLRVVDVTDPRQPQPLADWGAQAALGLGQEAGQGLEPAVYGHSVDASADGLRAYVSYWDAGVMILDLADPATPRLLGRTSFAPGEEGNSHSVALTTDEQVLIEATEVLTVEAPALKVDGPAEVAGLIRAAGSLRGPPWEGVSTITGPLAYVGRGCPAGDWTAQLNTPEARLESPDPYLSDPSGRIALIDRGLCPFGEKLERAATAGAIGAVIVNSVDEPLAPHSLQGTPLGAFGIPEAAGERLKAALAAGQSVRVTLDPNLRWYQDWGGLRFWDIADPAQPRLISIFQTPRSRVDPDQGPTRPGDFSAHNPVVQGELLFVSWYSDGVRVLDIRDPSAPRELDAWVPPGPTTAVALEQEHDGHAHGFEGPSVWGVAVEGDLVAASEMFSGLYVFRLVR